MANATAAAAAGTAVIKWLQSPEAILARVMVQVIAAILLLLILLVFGSCRRQSRNPALKPALWIAFTVSGLIASYTIGVMESANVRNQLLVVWAVFLLVVLGSSTSVLLYNIDEKDQGLRQKIQQLVQFLAVGLLAYSYGVADIFFLPPLVTLWALCLLRLLDIVNVLGVPSHSLGLAINQELIARYVIDEDTAARDLLDNDFPDPVTMKKYRYLVCGEERAKTHRSPPSYDLRLVVNPSVITVESIWHCRGELLSSTGRDADGRLKDVCLSFAMFKILIRRFHGQTMVETTYHKTRDFVFRGLLADHRRAFRLVEGELAFMYDFFFTKYPRIFSKAYPIPMLLLSLMMILVSSWVVVLLFVHRTSMRDSDEIHLVVYGCSVDLVVSVMVVLVILSLEIWQVANYVLADWMTVALVCKYVERPSWQANLHLERALGALCRSTLWWHRSWSKSLGQYPLLESFDSKEPGWRKILNPCQPLKRGRRAGAPIRLPIEVIDAVLRPLRSNDGRLNTGTDSLVRNRVSQLIKWGRFYTHFAETILVWNIATTLCDIAFKRKNHEESKLPAEVRANRTVARSLSGYCAHLAVFSPELLPEKSYVSCCIFDQAIEQGNELLRECKTMEQKYEKMMRPDMSHETMFGTAARLARHIVEQVHDEMSWWKILADMWADLILFMTPSSGENARYHAEHLAEGGEFITHLWALLSHAGFLEELDNCEPMY